jgi:hypothetical protein
VDWENGSCTCGLFSSNVCVLKLSGMALTYSEQLGPDLANATGLRQQNSVLRFPRLGCRHLLFTVGFITRLPFPQAKSR